jgi:hypothetical protein
MSRGVFHNEATVTALAGDALPSARQVAAAGPARGSGGVIGANVAAFGPTATSVTDTGARAFSGARAMPFSTGAPPAEQAAAATSAVWRGGALRQGAGAKGDVYTDRLGAGPLRGLTARASCAAACRLAFLPIDRHDWPRQSPRPSSPQRVAASRSPRRRLSPPASATLAAAPWRSPPPARPWRCQTPTPRPTSALASPTR